jgi:hypothetical protein
MRWQGGPLCSHNDRLVRPSVPRRKAVQVVLVLKVPIPRFRPISTVRPFEDDDASKIHQRRLPRLCHISSDLISLPSSNSFKQWLRKCSRLQIPIEPWYSSCEPMNSSSQPHTRRPTIIGADLKGCERSCNPLQHLS